jgi:hypothetical protein
LAEHRRRETRARLDREIVRRRGTELGGGTSPTAVLKRFAVLMSAQGADPRETQRGVMLVLNFFDEVRRRVAAAEK